MENEKPLHSLIPFDDFKALLGVDDREDTISRFCLVTATCTIEQYCKRRLLLKTHHELIESVNALVLPLSEYPVREVLAVYSMCSFDRFDLIEPDFYHAVPDCGCDEDVPFYLTLSPALLRLPGLYGFKVVYSAGYSINSEQLSVNSERRGVPPDLASACLELAGWNMGRYRGKRFGVTGNGRKEGERFEMAMPENVRLLLEPYKRKTI